MTDDETIYLTVDLMPISTNRIWLQSYRTRRTYLNPDYKVFRDYFAIMIAGKRMPKSWKFCAVRIVVHPKRRVGDADNYIKCILDSLTHAGFWDDDKVVADVRSSFGSPIKGGAVEIFIERRETKFTDQG